MHDVGIKRVKLFHAAIVSVLICAAYVAPAGAVGSTNFKIQEDFLGGSGNPGSSSGSYSVRDSAGAAASGGGAGSAFQTQAGLITPDEPTLAFAVNSASVALGGLSTAVTKTGTAAFSVLNYTSYGYVVQTIGDPPSNGAHTLTGLSLPASSAVGTEQFGINLVANTLPVVFGTSPIQIPTASFGFGVAAINYNIANTFTYNNGDVIASAPKSSGQTDYTISYIANVSNNTPGGSYSGEQTLVVTGTY